MIKEFIDIYEQIKKYDRIIIHRHIRPDGDCIGSQFGLKKFIETNFNNKKVYAVGDEIPTYLSYYGQNDEVTDDMYDGSLVIVVDTAVEEHICDKRYKNGAYLIKIDHHDDSPVYGDLAYIDAETPACSAILVKIFREWIKEYNLVMTKEIAIPLFVGIVTDTGRFRFRGVNGEVLTNAGFLIDQGIECDKIYTRLYIKDIPTLKLQGYVYDNFKTTPNGVVYIHFTKKIMKKFKVTKEEAANLVNSFDSIYGSLIWVAFVDQMKPKSKNCQNKEEQPHKETRVRIRSRFVSINEVATHYRGGGHLQASGATIYSKKEMHSLLNELDNVLSKYKAEHKELF